ncbi:MAG: hypothetical protein SCALA702_28970 [Melioribacteraceae bacterium]|nr:MAG: hypothetical protein SCALA702_28970 [Melioribacteraceae bacterium]
MNKAVFFDRDGTLNLDPGYLGDPNKVSLYEYVPEVLYKLKFEYNFKLFIVSNQSGIARGLIKESDVIAVNNRINEILNANDVTIDAFFYCPYHPDFSPPELCTCRKPSPEMVLKAAAEYNIDLKGSFFVGDKSSDILCGKSAGTKTVLVDYNSDENEIKTLKKVGISPNFVAGNFLDIDTYISGVLQEDNF